MMKLSMILAAVAATGAVGAPEKQQAAGDATAPVSGQLHARLREPERSLLADFCTQLGAGPPWPA